MISKFRGMQLNEVTIFVKDNSIGFSMNCIENDKVIDFDVKDIPIELLKIIYQRLREETSFFIDVSISATKLESEINKVIQDNNTSKIG